jgi:hypothetical protein
MKKKTAKASPKKQQEKPLTHRPLGNGKRLTRPEKLLILAEKGTKSQAETARQYGVAESTVRETWKDEGLAEHKREVALVKESMADDLYLTAHESIKNVNTKLQDANAYQSALIAGICIDKARLLTNQSTQNTQLLGYINICNNIPV